jgi:serine/threonine protein kinase
VSNLAGSALAPGTTVAGYRIEALIGRGGMGAVYRAEEEGLGRKVALKVIAPELASDERFRERFLRESRIAASLDHPHVIPIYQAGEDDGLLYLAMRYVEGYDLAKLIAEHGALDPKRTVDLLSQIAEALDAAHEKGLVHRDIKPSNVLIAEAAGKEHCYLGDFGLTKRTGSLSGVSVAGEIVGTLEYVAPEQITGDALDERADVYSLGCVLYECLTGQSPFPRATDVALLWAHVHEEPTPPSQARPELPKELDTVLARALAKEPGRRYRSAGELMAATRSALRLGDAPSVPNSRSPRTLAVGGLVVLLAVAVLAAFFLLRDSGSGISAVAPNSVGVIDSASAELADAVQVGIDPEAIAFGAGGVWVANVEDESITRIDPATHDLVRAAIGVSNYPSDVITGAGDAWVALGATAELVRINPEQNQPSEPLSAVGAKAGCGAPFASLAFGVGQVWFVCRGGTEFGSYDPRTGVARRLALECQLATFSKSTLPQYADMTFGLDTVWIANSAGNQVVGVDPVICQDPDEVSAGAGPIAVAVGGNALWVANFDADTVTRIADPAGGAPVSNTFDVGDGPSDLAVDENGVWVANKLDRNVMRLDPETGHVDATIELGNEPQRIAAGGGSVWVTVRAPRELESGSTTP